VTSKIGQPKFANKPSAQQQCASQNLIISKHRQRTSAGFGGGCWKGLILKKSAGFATVTQRHSVEEIPRQASIPADQPHIARFVRSERLDDAILRCVRSNTSLGMPAPGMQSDPFLLGKGPGVVWCLRGLSQNAEILICDIFLDLLVWLRDASQLRLCGFALECVVEC
jgi:hypothetical protein